MRLLVFSTDRTCFDVQSNVFTRFTAQAKLVDEMSVVVPTSKEAMYQPKVQGNLSLFPTRSSSRFMYLVDMFRAVKKILKAKGKSDWLVTTQDPFEVGMLAYLISVFYRIPLHVQIHTDPFSVEWQNERTSNKMRLLFAKFILRQADGIRVVSERVAVSLRDMHIPEERITKIPIFTDTAIFQQTIPAFSLKESYKGYHPIILSIGRLMPEKNFSQLVRAFNEFKKVETEALLLIVGSGAERDRLLSLVRSLGLGNAVQILPWARDVVSYYKGADVYVQPSRYEGWGLAVIEALSSGCPVIMTDVGCAGEIVINNETGLVVPPEDTEALVHALQRIIRDDKLRKQLIKSGKNKVQTLPTQIKTEELYRLSWEKAYTNGKT